VLHGYCVEYNRAQQYPVAAVMQTIERYETTYRSSFTGDYDAICRDDPKCPNWDKVLRLLSTYWRSKFQLNCLPSNVTDKLDTN
jgi:hypothetical protein